VRSGRDAALLPYIFPPGMADVVPSNMPWLLNWYIYSGKSVSGRRIPCVQCPLPNPLPRLQYFLAGSPRPLRHYHLQDAPEKNLDHCGVQHDVALLFGSDSKSQKGHRCYTLALDAECESHHMKHPGCVSSSMQRQHWAAQRQRLCIPHSPGRRESTDETDRT